MNPGLFLGIVLSMFAIFGVPEDTNKPNTINYNIEQDEVITIIVGENDEIEWIGEDNDQDCSEGR